MATLTKVFDPSKFQKSITKSIKGISTGFNDPDTWISTGNFALNKKISGFFDRGIPLGKISMFAGESGSGKSFICSGSVVKHAQEMGIYCVVIDSENALDEDWLKAVGVDTSPSKILKISASMIDDVAKILSDFISEYKIEHGDTPKQERPKILFVIDSLGMLLTPTEVNQFEAGDMKGDMGRKAKQLKALVSNLTNMIGELNIGILMTNHTYKSQDMFAPDDVVSGGSGAIFASSIIVAMKKLKLKEDANGAKTSEVKGIKCMVQVNKTRYAKPFEKIEIHIPWDSGLNPYSGLFDLFYAEGLITKSGNKYTYNSVDNQSFTYFEKDYNKNKGGILDLIMKDYDQKTQKFDVTTEDETPEQQEIGE